MSKSLLYSVHSVNDPVSKEERLTLELLDAIERRSDLSQRHLARQLGVALGLANSYLKRCAKKGLVKIREAPANRYFYYLTPKGFAEKARLTAQFLSTSLTFYRQAAESCSEIYEVCAKQQWPRVLLCGVSDLAEIAFVRSLESDASIVGLYEPDSEAKSFFSLPVWTQWDECAGADAYVVTGLRSPLELYRFLVRQVPTERIFVPRVLGLNPALADLEPEED